MNKLHICTEKPRFKTASFIPQPYTDQEIARGLADRDTRWPNGSILRVRFMEPVITLLKDQYIEENQEWQKHCNILFDFDSPDEDAEIRVSFDQNDGAWSYIGTDALSVPKFKATSNIGFYQKGTCAHEGGHAISLLHEHQSVESPIIWNEEVVIRDLSGAPNFWTIEQIRHNVLSKRVVSDFTVFDPDSIMLYGFPSGWTLNNIATKQNTEISAIDAEFVGKLYPFDDDPVVVVVPPVEPDDPIVPVTPTEPPVQPPKKKDRRIMYVIGGILAGLAVLAFILH